MKHAVMKCFFSSSLSLPANTCKYRLADTLVGDRHSCELKQECAQSHRPSERNCHAHIHKHTQQRPLLSLFLLPAECWLHFILQIYADIWEYTTRTSSTLQQRVYELSYSAVKYDFLKWVSLEYTILSSSRVPFSLLCWYIVCTVWWKKSSITVELKANHAFRPAAMLFQDTQMRGRADK